MTGRLCYYGQPAGHRSGPRLSGEQMDAMAEVFAGIPAEQDEAWHEMVRLGQELQGSPA
jgi:hypothetical protein